MTSSKLLLTAFATSLSVTALAGCATISDVPTERIASATLSLTNGVPAGTVQLLASGNQLSLAVAVTGISEGEHGFHLHTTGECKRPDFTSAGGHLNPTGQTHGKLSPGGQHLGDLPNLIIGSSKTVSTTIDIEGDQSQIIDDLFDTDGTAVIVHAGPDDYRTDPSGDAGSRIACGVLTRA